MQSENKIGETSDKVESQPTLKSNPLITTSELVEIAKSYSLEAWLSLSGGLQSTHFISSNGVDLFSDEGCDGEANQYTREVFLEYYPDNLGAVWRIDSKTLRVFTVIANADIIDSGFDLSREKDLPPLF